MPQLVERPRNCLSCAYPLGGIPAPGACPECGVAFSDGLSIIQLNGVAKHGPGPKWRRGVWVMLAIVTFLVAQLSGILYMVGLAWLGLLLLLAIVVSFVAMALTAKQRKSGVEIFSITPGGIARNPRTGGVSPGEYTAWGDATPQVLVERVGKFWAKIELARRLPDGKQEVILEAGFRCPAADIPVLEQLIVMQISGRGLSERASIPGYERSIFAFQDGHPDHAEKTAVTG